MNPKLEKKEKTLNISIVICCVIILVLFAFMVSTKDADSIMGNSVYTEDGKYEIGEIVEYSKTNWYVMSENNKSYTLLRENALSAEEINSYNLGIKVGINGEISYDSGYDCNEKNSVGCSASLEDSTIGKVLNAYQKTLDMKDLITVGDYTIRLITVTDFNSLKQYEWLYLPGYYWTMSKTNFGNINIYGLSDAKNISVHMAYDGSNEISGGLVRPVINVKKSEIN